MIVVVEGRSGQVLMDDADNLRALSVEFRGCDAIRASDLLGTLGRVEGDHVWLHIEGLRRLSPLAGNPEWASGFDGVMAYAQTKGWIDRTGTHVRAHIDQPAEEGG